MCKLTSNFKIIKKLLVLKPTRLSGFYNVLGMLM